jgi:hypothetical protein
MLIRCPGHPGHYGSGVQNGVVDVNANINIARATSRIATADYSRNGKPAGIAGSLDSSNPPMTLSCSACLMDPCLGRRQNHLGRLVYTGDRTAFSRKATAA